MVSLDSLQAAHKKERHEAVGMKLKLLRDNRKLKDAKNMVLLSREATAGKGASPRERAYRLQLERTEGRGFPKPFGGHITP